MQSGFFQDLTLFLIFLSRSVTERFLIWWVWASQSDFIITRQLKVNMANISLWKMYECIIILILHSLSMPRSWLIWIALSLTGLSFVISKKRADHPPQTITFQKNEKPSSIQMLWTQRFFVDLISSEKKREWQLGMVKTLKIIWFVRGNQVKISIDGMESSSKMSLFYV